MALQLVAARRRGDHWKAAASRGKLTRGGNASDRRAMSELGIISGARHLAWDDLGERVREAAGGLARLGIGEGDTVALLMRNDTALLEASLAAVRCGAYAVPINWHFKADEVAYILKDSGARLIVAHTDLLRPVREAVPAGVELLVVPTPAEVAAAYGLSEAEVQMPAGSIAWPSWRAAQAPSEASPPPPRESMIYTSGTTGAPKGAVLTHRNLLANSESVALTWRWQSDDRLVHALPIFHGHGLCVALYTSLLRGSSVVLLPRFDPGAVLDASAAHEATMFFGVPTMYH
ncbi:MAG: AMP-binding protein, partial [Alphaproteobacteria bacterium]